MLTPEGRIQQQISKYLKDNGCLVLKNMSVSLNGWPDLTVIEPDGTTYHIEVKAPGGRLSKIQKYRITQIREHNTNVFIVDSLTLLKEELNESKNQR